MTSVSEVSGSSGSSILQMLKSIAQQRSEEGSTCCTAAVQGASTGQATWSRKFEEALVTAGVDSSKLDEVRSKLQSAVSTALSSVDGTTDARQAVAQAVESTLSEYGVDTEQLKAQMKPEKGSMRPPGPPPGGGGEPEDMSSQMTDALTAAGVDSSQLEEIQSALETAISSVTSDSDAEGDPEAIKSAVHEVLNQYGVDTAAFDEEMESGRPAPPSSSETGSTSGLVQNQSLLNYVGNTTSASDSFQWLAGMCQWLDETI